MGAETMRRVRGAAWALAATVAGLAGWWALKVATRDPLEGGKTAYERGDWSRAAETARRRLRERPGDPEALALLARSVGRLGRLDEARAIYSSLKAGAMRAEDFLVVSVGLHGPALGRVLEQARGAEPDHPGVLYELSRYYARGDRLAEAMDLAGRLADRPGWKVRGSLMLGLLRHELPDPAGASLALARALRLSPSLEGAMVSATEPVRKLLARDLLSVGRPEEAEAQLRTVLAASPDREASWLLSRARLQCGDSSGAAAALADARGFDQANPQAHEPAPFVGSARCAECHEELHRAQRSSRHARTFRPVDAALALPLPDEVVTDPAEPSASHAIRRDEDGRVRWEAQAKGETLRALVEYAFGSGAHGLTPVGRDEEGRFRQLRLSHYPEKPGWDLTTGLSPHPADSHDLLGEVLTADGLRRCLGCHTTDPKAARDGVGPLAVETGFSCERCHGPGGNHLAAIAATFADPAIGRPKLATSAQVVTLCSTCHAPRGREIRPGDPAVVRFQGITITRSRCYTESGGGLSCVTCHDPHRDAESRAAHYESACLKCHGPSPRRDGKRPTACPVNPAHDCVSCHMPPVRGVVAHITFTDHHIRAKRKGAASGD